MEAVSSRTPYLPLGRNCLRIVLGKMRRHIERTLLQVIPAAPSANRPQLNMPSVGCHFTRQGDDEIPPVGPRLTQRAIAVGDSLHGSRLDVKIRPLALP